MEKYNNLTPVFRTKEQEKLFLKCCKRSMKLFYNKTLEDNKKYFINYKKLIKK